MSTLMRRLEKLESRRKQDRELTVILYSFAGDGPHVKASCGGDSLFRNADEDEDQFLDRVEGWANGLPHDGHCQTVWMSREDEFDGGELSAVV